MCSGKDEFYMSLALQEAWKYQGLTYPNPAVGCAIVSKDGILISVKAHKQAGCAHAELRAVKSALKKLNSKLKFPKNPNELHDFILKNHNDLLKDASIYVTLEPCSHQGKTPSCAFLLKSLHVKKVIIGSLDENKEASGGSKILSQSNIKIIKSKKEHECKELVEPFFSWQKGNFSFFKLAMSINGVINGGLITGLKSRTFVHQLRDKCDSLLIGGNTVRIDRPTLDARLCQGKAPDILIYSKRKEFDKTIPLFSVKGRKVITCKSFKDLDRYRFTMIEGGEKLINTLPDKVQYFLIFHSTKFINAQNIKTDLKLKLLYQNQIGEDSYGWYKKI